MYHILNVGVTSLTLLLIDENECYLDLNSDDPERDRNKKLCTWILVSYVCVCYESYVSYVSVCY